jgi:shikimate kinase/3-dehydroquinate synthase
VAIRAKGLRFSMIDRLVLIGFSGTGKSTIGAEVATRLGWELIDTDSEIVNTTGLTIPEIFDREGESAFRQYERAELVRALDQPDVVVATGGGAVVAEDAWAPNLLGRPDVLVVALEAPAEVIHQRLSEAKALHGDAVKRPLLDLADSLQKIREMKASRKEAYARAGVTIPVESRTVVEIVDDLEELIRLANGNVSIINLDFPSTSSRIVIGKESRRLLPETIRAEWPKTQRIWIAADEHVTPHAEELAGVLGAEGFDTKLTYVPSGESRKSIEGLSALYDWLLDNGVQRQDVLIALGGGKVGDLAGFAAATVLRGIGLVQIPTTLLAMVDSSIGGKTAINHPTGKNLIGAFYQPSHVLIDPELLATVPSRELISGWAEVIKHGEIQRSTPGGSRGHLRRILELNQPGLSRLDNPVLPWVIRQNLTIKAAVVIEDEKESGLRAILNYGHTLGHAIEASGYSCLHGEAIAVGLVGAVRLAAELERIDPAEIERIEQTLTRYGLPIRAKVELESVLGRISSDKKKTSGKQQWVLANRDGTVSIETDVPLRAIASAATEILAG